MIHVGAGKSLQDDGRLRAFVINKGYELRSDVVYLSPLNAQEKKFHLDGFRRLVLELNAIVQMVFCLGEVSVEPSSASREKVYLSAAGPDPQRQVQRTLGV